MAVTDFFKLVILIAMLFVSAIVIAEPENFPRLTDSIEPILQAELERSVEKLGLAEAVREKRLAVALVDITDRKNPHLASVNGDQMMYSASLPKIAILFGAFQRLEEGSLRVNKQMLKDMTDMIRYSSNVAASRMLEIIEPYYLLRLLQSDKYRFYDVHGKGGLWVGKAYGKNPAFRRDPLFSISHGATTLQVARFYYLLETGRLVSREASKIMKEILSKPGLNHKFVAGLKSNYPDASIYRKSGTWQTYHSDSAIVERDGRTYIAVALANDQNGGEWLSRLIVEMDNIIFSNYTDSRIAAGTFSLPVE